MSAKNFNKDITYCNFLQQKFFNFLLNVFNANELLGPGHYQNRHIRL